MSSVFSEASPAARGSWTVVEWKHGSTPKAGVFIFDREGRYTGTTELAMQCAPERIAVDSNGDMFASSLDAAYLKGREKDCSLVHKFTRQGQHVVSFSACPPAAQAEGARPGVRGTAVSALRAEAERGHVWIQNGQLYHVLPSSRLLRVFDRDGRAVREATLVSPDSARRHSSRCTARTGGH